MSHKIRWEINCFQELTIDSLYALLRLRSEVFIIEQNSTYQDLDAKDQRAVHLQGFVNDELVAYCRLFKAGDYFSDASIGRVVVSPKYRRCNFGNLLMQKAIDLQTSLFKVDKIHISAQLYLQKFYESHGFVQTSETYLEDNIPHIGMDRVVVLT